MGPEGAAACLEAGANDLGGTLMNESISRAAGTEHGQELPPARDGGADPLARARAAAARHALSPGLVERRAASFAAAALAPVVQTPPVRRALATTV